MKNAITYYVEELPSIEQLEECMCEHIAVSPSDIELMRSGWEYTSAHELVTDCHGVWLIELKTSWRDVPGQVVRDAIAERIIDIEELQGRKVYAKEKRQLKDDVIASLLPKAFIKSRSTIALIDPGASMIHIDATSHKAAEAVLTKLRESIGTLKVRLPEIGSSASAVMSDWVSNKSNPGSIKIEDECKLVDAANPSESVSLKGCDLESDESIAHILNGMVVDRLAIEWKESVLCMLHSDMTLHKIKLTDAYADQREQFDAEDEQSEIEANGWMWGRLLRDMHKDLATEFNAK